MPIYEYQCQKCKKVQEIWQKITEDPVKKCPLCGGKLDRLISAVGFELKGGGWYKDGYTSKKSGASESSGDGSPSADSSSKSESKGESAGSTSSDSGAKPADPKVAARAKAEKAEKAQDVRPGKKNDPNHKSNSPKAKN